MKVLTPLAPLPQTAKLSPSAPLRKTAPVLTAEYGLMGRSRGRKLRLTFVFIAAVLLEGGLAWSSNRTHFVPKPRIKEVEVAVAIQMPKLEQEEPEIVERGQVPDKVEIAPPMQNDVPQVAAPDSFVVPIEPPPPDVSALSSMVVKIPETRGMLGNVTVIDISQLDQIPVAKFRASPTYPFEAKRAKLEGSVMVEFIVDTNGTVRNAHAYRSSDRIFEENAVEAVQKWKFSAGRKGGHTVYTHMMVPILFHITQD